MTPWIQVYTNLMTHRKICKLRSALGLKTNYEAVGLIVCVWAWAAVNAVDGNITDYTSRDIADAVGYKKAPAKFQEALIDAGFVDITEDGKTMIHDWNEHAALLINSYEHQKEKTRERVKRHREKRKQGENVECSSECNGYCNVTSPPCNAPTLPNLTLPNPTINISGDGGDSACAIASDDDLGKIGLEPGGFWYVTKETVLEIQKLTKDLFAAYSNVDVTAYDFRKVFIYVARFVPETGRQEISSDACGLLKYSFEAAHNAGHSCKWSYIDGVMGRLSVRQIMTEKQAREWDDERPDKDGGV